MALGAATVVGRYCHDGRPALLDVVSFAGDNAYPAGGTPNFRAYVQQAVARGHLDLVAVVSLKGPPVYYDPINDKLQVFASQGGAEASGSQAGTTFELLVISV